MTGPMPAGAPGVPGGAAVAGDRRRVHWDGVYASHPAEELSWFQARAEMSLFDLWHDRAVFHFLVKAEDRQGYRAAMTAALKPGGQAIIGTFAADGPERCSGLPVVRYEPEALAAELGADFRFVESAHEDHRTPSGKLQRFQFSRFIRR